MSALSDLLLKISILWSFVSKIIFLAKRERKVFSSPFFANLLFLIQKYAKVNCRQNWQSWQKFDYRKYKKVDFIFQLWKRVRKMNSNFCWCNYFSTIVTSIIFRSFKISWQNYDDELPLVISFLDNFFCESVKIKITRNLAFFLRHLILNFLKQKRPNLKRSCFLLILGKVCLWQISILEFKSGDRSKSFCRAWKSEKYWPLRAGDVVFDLHPKTSV